MLWLLASSLSQTPQTCISASACSWPQEYCECNDPYTEPVEWCSGGSCQSTPPELQFQVVQYGGGCNSHQAGGGKIWWRHSYTSDQEASADVTLDADFDTGKPHLCARAAAMDSRCGDMIQYSPAYSWEWGCFCCPPNATTAADNANWNVLSYTKQPCEEVTLVTQFPGAADEASVRWMLDEVLTSVTCGGVGTERAWCAGDGLEPRPACC